ncbi:MAG TPA: hypothetical protein VGB83_04615 [Actinomycetota bacterium]
MRAVLGAAAAAGAATALLGAALTRSPIVRSRNHRGLLVPSAAGLAPVLATAGALWWLHGSRPGAGPGPAIAALAFGMLGLIDDVAGGSGPRGWKAHLRSIRDRRPSTGALKLTGGVVAALLIARAIDPSVETMVVRAAALAMTANLANLLDVRPGRAGKGLLVVSALLLATGPRGGAPSVVVVAAGVMAFLPFDLRERAMLGDAGANGLGAALGAVLATSTVASLVALGALVPLHVLAERPGFTALIERSRRLDALDRWGRPA